MSFSPSSKMVDSDEKSPIAPDSVIRGSNAPNSSDEKAAREMATLAEVFALQTVATLARPAAADTSYTMMKCTADVSMRVNTDHDIKSIIIKPRNDGTRSTHQTSRDGESSLDSSSSPLRLATSSTSASNAFTGRKPKRQRTSHSAAAAASANEEECKYPEADVDDSSPGRTAPKLAKKKISKSTTQVRFQRPAAAAAQTGLLTETVKAWIHQGLVSTLRPGSEQSHRLVDVEDLRRVIELKRENPDREARQELEEMHREQQEESNAPSNDKLPRTLLYARLDSDKVAPDLSEEEYEKLLGEECVRLHQLCGLPKGDPRGVCSETASADNFDRPGFTTIIDLILQRRIDRLVVLHRNRICPDGAWPLFEWLCNKHDVAIVCPE